jgi:DNA recombination protein RmuC
MNMMGDVERLRDRVSKLGSHFDQVNEDVRQVLISVNKIGKRAAKIEELDFEKVSDAQDAPTAKAPELFAAPRKLQAGE